MKKTIGYVMLGLAAVVLQNALVYVGLKGGPGAWAPLWMEAGIIYIGATMWCLK
jgi:hypothetical protein